MLARKYLPNRPLKRWITFIPRPCLSTPRGTFLDQPTVSTVRKEFGRPGLSLLDRYDKDARVAPDVGPPRVFRFRVDDFRHLLEARVPEQRHQRVFGQPDRPVV